MWYVILPSQRNFFENSVSDCSFTMEVKSSGKVQAKGSTAVTLSHTGPRIPDEWRRESVKMTSKNVRSKQSTTVEIERSTNNSPLNPTTETLAESMETDKPLPPPIARKKRKRPSTKAPTLEDKTKVPDVPVISVTAVTPPASKIDIPPVVSDNRVPDHVSCKNYEETESVMRGLYHQVEKLSQRPGCALTEGIYLDSIMTHIPYVEVLQQMFGGDSATSKPSVPLVTRAYEESYMREVVGSTEESCVMGTNCECQFVDEHNPFVGVQFTLPVEMFTPQHHTIDEDLISNKLCVLCCRKNTQALFYDALYNHRAFNGCIQLYGNICDRPGEYATEAMLICPLSGPINNMPLPIVAHQRNRYSVLMHNGVRQLRQHRVGYEDFRVPSSSRC
jgi:hypothetical protein